jgi:hypothetical protein
MQSRTSAQHPAKPRRYVMEIFDKMFVRGADNAMKQPGS